MPSINNMLTSNDPTFRTGDAVIVALGFAVLTYFVGEWLLGAIDQTFFAVVCKAKYFAPPK
ncbi:hypothetical protein V8Z74_15135 [Comamonas sp. w2-DMI]|uniref:hypothetical protein n=1 Tax=Comamonas sp. w2-DMI TaxID=3126391 RepID=UPI0032E52E2B